MAFTVYEHFSVTPNGVPIQPANIRTTSVANGVIFELNAATCYVVVIPGADMHLRISSDGADGTSDDYALTYAEAYGFPVFAGAGTKLYGTT